MDLAHNRENIKKMINRLSQPVVNMTEEEAKKLITQMVEQFGNGKVYQMVYQTTVQAEWSVLGDK